MDMANPISSSTARDMIKGILEYVTVPPSMEAAIEISDEYLLRGVYIRPDYLLDVWREMCKER